MPFGVLRWKVCRAQDLPHIAAPHQPADGRGPARRPGARPGAVAPRPDACLPARRSEAERLRLRRASAAIQPSGRVALAQD